MSTALALERDHLSSLHSYSSSVTALLNWYFLRHCAHLRAIIEEQLMKRMSLATCCCCRWPPLSLYICPLFDLPLFSFSISIESCSIHINLNESVAACNCCAVFTAVINWLLRELVAAAAAAKEAKPQRFCCCWWSALLDDQKSCGGSLQKKS